MLDVRPLTTSDVPAACRLSTRAGWNQIDADWHRLRTLWPQTCLAGESDGRMVATATVACFGPLGWIGMMLVDEAHRGRGYGSIMFKHAMAAAENLGVSHFGLDATGPGRRVYRKHGFSEQGPIVRWMGSATAADDQGTSVMTDRHWPAIDHLDRAAHGVARGPLLRTLLGEPGTTGRVLEEDDRLIGFGLSRRGRQASMIGPVVAQTPTAAERLAHALIADRATNAPAMPVILDVPPDQPFTVRRFTPQRELIRMTRPADARCPLAGPTIFCAAGFELG